ncbi:glycoside hydrolase family 18 protein, partial [Moniliophthora roreri]
TSSHWPSLSRTCQVYPCCQTQRSAKNYFPLLALIRAFESESQV